jgi:hypothetical protein
VCTSQRTQSRRCRCETLHLRRARSTHPPAQSAQPAETSLFFNLSKVFVPSLSWQMFGLNLKWGCKKGVSFRGPQRDRQGRCTLVRQSYPQCCCCRTPASVAPQPATRGSLRDLSAPALGSAGCRAASRTQRDHGPATKQPLLSIFIMVVLSRACLGKPWIVFYTRKGRAIKCLSCNPPRPACRRADCRQSRTSWL